MILNRVFLVLYLIANALLIILLTTLLRNLYYLFFFFLAVRNNHLIVLGEHPGPPLFRSLFCLANIVSILDKTRLAVVPPVYEQETCTRNVTHGLLVEGVDSVKLKSEGA